MTSSEITFFERVTHPDYPSSVAEVRGVELADDDKTRLLLVRWLTWGGSEAPGRRPAYLVLSEAVKA